MIKRQVKAKIATTERYNPKLTSWQKIKKSILKIEADAFPQYEAKEEVLAKDFTNKNNIVILLRSSRNSIIGYAYAEPIGQAFPRRKKETDTAYVTSVAIAPRFQGKGLVGYIHKSLNRTLKRKGYSFFEGEIVNETYARTLTKVYADRLVKKRRFINSDDEVTHFMRIRLD